jgi:hypothetical protein
LIDMIEKGNVTGAVAATNHHLSAIEERLITRQKSLPSTAAHCSLQQNRSGRCRHRPLPALIWQQSMVVCGLAGAAVQRAGRHHGARPAWLLRVDDLGTDDILTTLVLVMVMDWLIGLTKRMSS